MKTAFENGINMFDTAETYANGKSEEEMFVAATSCTSDIIPYIYQGSRHQGIGLAPH